MHLDQPRRHKTNKTWKTLFSILLLSTFSCQLLPAMQLSITQEKIATYIHVKKILTISQNIALALEQKKMCSNFLSADGLSRVDTKNDQLRQGLSLCVTLCPRCLASPWGRIIIYENPQNVSYRFGEEFRRATLLLFKHVQATFEYASNPENTYTIPSILDSPDILLILSKRLSKEAYNKVRGTPTPVFSLNEGATYYTINAVQGEPCPPPQFLDESLERSEEEISAELAILERISQEQQERNPWQPPKIDLPCP